MECMRRRQEEVGEVSRADRVSELCSALLQKCRAACGTHFQLEMQGAVLTVPGIKVYYHHSIGGAERTHPMVRQRGDDSVSVTLLIPRCASITLQDAHDLAQVLIDLDILLPGQVKLLLPQDDLLCSECR